MAAMAALPTALAVAAWLPDTPFTCWNANYRHAAASARNWSNGSGSYRAEPGQFESFRQGLRLSAPWST
jgi:hypothetical protein